MTKKHNHPPRQKRPPAHATTPTPNPLLQHAVAHHEAGRLGEAEALYRKVLAAEPEQPVALHLLGVIAHQVGQNGVALELIDAALKSNDQYAEAHNNRGIVLYALRRFVEAVESYDTACLLNPGFAEACNNRGNSLSRLDRHQAALESCDRAIALRPGYAEAHNNRGNALQGLGQFAAAVESYDRAIALNPHYADAYSNRGNALQAIHLKCGAVDKRDSSGRDLVFYCGRTSEVWNPEIANAVGIGGSEEAVVWLSRLLHHRGWNVTVYANCGTEPHSFDGVQWKPYWLWNYRDKQNVTILWRYPSLVDHEINSDRIVLDLHDVMPEAEFAETRLRKLDRIFVKSRFHRSLFPDVPDEKFVVISNGIDARLFAGDAERDAMLLINTSSADRSLEAFLDCFEQIRRQVPEARAEWAYGWGVWDATHSASTEKMAWKAAMQARMQRLGVVELGRLSHTEVARLYLRANVFAYPSEMAEIDCISLSKAMAAGAVPLTTDFAAMGEKAGHGGVFLRSRKTREDWALPGQFHFEMTDAAQKAEFVREAVKLLRNPPGEDERAAMRRWARSRFDWDAVAEVWHRALAGGPQRHAAVASYDKALELNPNHAEAHNNRGSVLHGLLEYEAALGSYERAIDLRPDYADAHSNRGNALLALKRYPEALASFERALEIDPGYEYLRGARLYIKRLLCDWTGSEAEGAELEAAIARGERAALPFATLALSESAAVQRRAAEIYTRDKHPGGLEAAPVFQVAAGERIRIGYFSSDFYNHATSYLMAELFERHDRSRFEIVGFSFGPDAGDEMGRRVARAMDRFLDVRASSEGEIAALSRSLQVDIAVDLKGYTRDHRAGIFAARAAPIQVSYVGYPGTMGAPYIDYLIADRTIIPEELRGYYTEKIVSLPHSYQPNDSRRMVSAARCERASEGLPVAGFVFCCFNNAYKITPRVFDVWMRILARVEGSVLWLLEENAATSANLRRGAERHGVGAERLVFARPAALPEHLARHALADLFLDTLPYNAHTTASDALWAGVPVVTRMGETFAGRVAASLLRAAELPELVTTTEAEFEELAVGLGLDPSRCRKLRERLLRSRSSVPLFDMERFTRDLERGYAAMQDRYAAGLAPEHLEL